MTASKIRLSHTERSEIVSILDTRMKAELANIDALDPGWRDRIESRKNKVAVGRLKIEKDLSEKEKLEESIREIRRKIDVIDARIAKRMPLKEREGRRSGWEDEDSCPMPKDLCAAVAKIANQVHSAEMAKDATGRKVLEIEKKYLDRKSRLALCSTREDVAGRKVFE